MRQRKTIFLVSLILSVLLLSSFLQAEEKPQKQRLTIPMRDGYPLKADLFLPPGQKDPLPCLLIRTPRGLQRDGERLSKLTSWGYGVILEECRSCTAQGVAAMPYAADGWGKLQDGYDTVEWIAAQPFCNGKVATFGESALGITQLMLAPSAPPHLTCQYVKIATPTLFHHGIFPGGQFQKAQVEGWLSSYSDPSLFVGFIKNQMDHKEYWERFDARSVAEKIEVPAVHVGGWFDIFNQGTLDAFEAAQNRGGEGARGKQKLVVGPWVHMWPKEEGLGDFQVPESGQHFPSHLTSQAWFAHHLLGESNGVEEAAPVTYYVMGPLDGSPGGGNFWREADNWPIPAVQTSFFLAPQGTLTDDGLSLGGNQVYDYVYAPHDPAPTVGGRNLFLPAGPRVQNELEEREDVLLFTSGVLEKEMEVTGRVRARLFVHTDQKDMDVVVRLCDVYPDGKSVLLAEGLARLGDQLSPEEIQGREPVAVDVDLWSTSTVFSPGHRIRVTVTSSNYPKFELNPQGAPQGKEGEPPPVAHNKLFVGKDYASRLQLPVVSAPPASRS